MAAAGEADKFLELADMPVGRLTTLLCTLSVPLRGRSSLIFRVGFGE